MATSKTALVISAGGMFGAWQAGAWRALSRFFQPDIVVGASIGSLNGWAIAGGCDPQSWVDMWLCLERGQQLRYRMPHSIFDGILHPALFEEWVQTIYTSFTPRLPYGLVITELPRLRPRLVRTPDVTWQHLAASCAVPGMLPIRLIEGKRWIDGGVLTPLPLWAAAEMGATRILALNVLKEAPSAFRIAAQTLRALAPSGPSLPPNFEALVLSPAGCLGSARDAFRWRRENAAKWATAGYNDVLSQEQIIQKMFCPESI
jgi:predicted acylesterase/phospholipase RssA